MKKLIVSVFLVVVVVAGLASLMVIQMGGATAAQVVTVKMVSCRYLSNDRYGPCIDIEQQLGTKCNPPSTAHFMNWETEKGSLQRRCAMDYQTDYW